MELGATICRARSVACPECPVARWCEAFPTIQSSLGDYRPERRAERGRFEETNRYVRGQIIDILRDAPVDGVSCAEVFARMPAQAGPTNRAQFTRCVRDLLREGMIETLSAPLHAAESTAPYDGADPFDGELFRLPV